MLSLPLLRNYTPSKQELCLYVDELFEGAGVRALDVRAKLVINMERQLTRHPWLYNYAEVNPDPIITKKEMVTILRNMLMQKGELKTQ